MTRTFNLAATGLDAVGESLRFEATDGVAQVNLLAGELARVNLRLARASNASSDQTALLDQRDSLLQQLSTYVDVSATISRDETVEVRLGGSSGQQLVMGGTATPFAMTSAADGTISFTLGGSPVPRCRSLAGKAQALTKLADVRDKLDTIATGMIAAINAAQAGGVALDGSAGQPLLAGTSAATIALGFESGALIATAPPGSPANSRDPGNLPPCAVPLPPPIRRAGPMRCCSTFPAPSPDAVSPAMRCRPSPGPRASPWKHSPASISTRRPSTSSVTSRPSRPRAG